MSLSRGTKLTREAFAVPLTTAAGKLVSASTNELEHARAPWSLHFHLPLVTHFPWKSGAKQNYSIPFMLAPTQDAFPVSGQSSMSAWGEVPAIPTLEEVHFSWDQRDEPSAIHENMLGYNDVNYSTGGLNCHAYDMYAVLAGDAYDMRDEVQRLDVTISIHEKTPTYWQATPSEVIERTVWSFTIPSLAWGRASVRLLDGTFSDDQKAFRINPFVISGLNIALDPLKTYLLSLDVPGLRGDVALPALSVGKLNLCMPNVNMVLKGSARLLTRDQAVAGTEVQNMPVSESVKVPAVITIATPAADAVITETNTDAEIAKIDQALLNQLKGGLDRDGIQPAAGNILHDAAYTVLAIPMFGHPFPYGKVDDVVDIPAGTPVCPDLAYQPYCDKAYDPTVANTQPTMFGERRIIRVVYPFVVHQVIAAVNNASPDFVPDVTDPSEYSEVGKFYNEGANAPNLHISVALGAGIRSNKSCYQQVAYALNPSTIDTIRSSVGVSRYRLLNIPLVGAGLRAGVGYPGQGRPFYVGAGDSRVRSRTQAYDATAAAFVDPITTGQEQFIEVHWLYKATAGHLLTNLNRVYSGLGGSWVFLIGKVPLQEG